jgi:hypothetical protein
MPWYTANTSHILPDVPSGPASCYAHGRLRALR